MQVATRQESYITQRNQKGRPWRYTAQGLYTLTKSLNRQRKKFRIIVAAVRCCMPRCARRDRVLCKMMCKERVWDVPVWLGSVRDEPEGSCAERKDAQEKTVAAISFYRVQSICLILGHCHILTSAIEPGHIALAYDIRSKGEQEMGRSQRLRPNCTTCPILHSSPSITLQASTSTLVS
jgi:hypothetical protein